MSSGFYDVTIATNHQCPECSYEWHDAGCSVALHACPKCKYEWLGSCRPAEVSGDQLALIELDPVPVEAANPAVEPARSPANAVPTEGGCDSPSTDPAGRENAVRQIGPSEGPNANKGTRRDYSPMLEVAPVSEQQTAFAEVVAKPPYRIPTMAEILATPKNGYTVVSTFSGCGGSSLGFRWAGFTSLWSSEFIPEAANTYHANLPDVPLGVQDIREVEPELLLQRLGLERGELDVLEGSPPCASFSMAGKRDSHWGEVKAYSDTKQRTDDLLMEYARLLWGLRPRAFVMENVPGLLGGKARGYFKEVMGAFGDAGYSRVMARVVDAQWLGVPQRRKRAIIIGFRDDLSVPSRFEWFPEKLAWRYSIRDALPHLVGGRLLEPGHGYFDGRVTQSDEQQSQVFIVVDQRSSTFTDDEYITPSLDEPIPTITKTGVGGDDRYDWRLVGDVTPTEEELEGTSIEGYAIHAEWKKLAPGESSDKYLNLVRPDPDAPLPTVTQLGGHSPGVASVTHPSEPRKFTLAELRRLCGFPDDFALTGTYSQGWERLGRAVPPPMMRAVASRVAEILKEVDS